MSSSKHGHDGDGNDRFPSGSGILRSAVPPGNYEREVIATGIHYSDLDSLTPLQLRRLESGPLAAIFAM